MIGERIRQARLAAGLTQDEVVARLSEAGRTITKAGLSKYENNGSTPGAAFLYALGQVLNLRASFFITEPSFSITWRAFRKKAGLGVRMQEEIKAAAEITIEGQLWLQDLMGEEVSNGTRKPWKIQSLEDVEEVAGKLRGHWKLGNGPILSLINAIEDKGCIVVGIRDSSENFDALSGLANSRVPTVIANLDMPADRLRYNVAHELGHLFLKCPGNGEDQEERFAHRFAAAFLVPKESAISELGNKRRSLNLSELGLLKREYGLSMQAWIRRARDLGIIKESTYKSLFVEFSKRGWRKNEPVEFKGDEAPTKLMQMTLRALEEKVISEEKAKQLCPGLVIEDLSTAPAEPERPLTASQLLELPRKERLEYLKRAAEKAAKEYEENDELVGFDAYGDDDIYD